MRLTDLRRGTGASEEADITPFGLQIVHYRTAIGDLQIGMIEGGETPVELARRSEELALYDSLRGLALCRTHACCIAHGVIV